MRTILKIAWLQLAHHPWRLVAALAGIAFSAVLILVQTGLDTALNDGVTKLYSHLGADLVMISRQYQCQVTTESFPRRYLARALAIPGVRSADPLYMAQVEWKNPETHRERVISILGVPANPDAIRLPGASRSIALLDEGRGIAFDEGSRPEFGAIAKRFRENGIVTTEVSGSRISVAALFQLGASFASDGTLLASYENFFRLAQGRRSDQVDIGLITLDPGADPEAVRSRLSALIGPDAEVLTRQGLVEREGNYWSDSLAVGYILGMNALLGLVVGIVIVYQILYTGVSDNLPEYATLKALGFPDRWLLSIVLCQGLLLSALGYIPALLIAVRVYSLTREVTSLPLEMTAYRAGVVYVVVLVMCVISAAGAMRKVRTADPAEIF